MTLQMADNYDDDLNSLATDNPATFEVAEPLPEVVIPPVEEDKSETVDTPDVAPETAETTEAEALAEALTAAVDETPSEPEKPKKIMIPKGRFDEAIRKEREKTAAVTRERDAALARLSGDITVDAPDLTELKALGELLLDGKTDEYAAKMAAMLQASARAGAQAAVSRSDATTMYAMTEQALLQERMSAAAEIQAAYPVFDPDSASFDDSILNEALMLRDSYEQQGFTPRAAIERAAFMVAAVNGLAPVTGQEPVPVPAQVSKPGKLPERTVADKIKLAAGQPPAMPGRTETEAPTIQSRLASMTDEEFDALPESELNKLRQA